MRFVGKTPNQQGSWFSKRRPRPRRQRTLGTTGDWEGRRRYCAGKSDVQEQRQSSSSEMIGRTSDSVQCSTARRDGEQSNQAPAQSGAGASPCCEAASWVQGSFPGRGVVPGHSRCFTWAVVRRATTVEEQCGPLEHGSGRGRDAVCMQPHRDALSILLAFLGHFCRLMGAGRPVPGLLQAFWSLSLSLSRRGTGWSLRPASPPMPISTSRVV